uniref:Uncharacterized protein n=1 Tax=Candidatus Kentrum sp. FM TaxID=2126340 RepID=A0A450VVM3_9GAMM|nr:MAG: hypothetical protein BECKFM1743A_GA0114220_100917 [Candidatus Kentron sp. FM]VFJ51269.1 MAG: hypothetical protein BECKFM1743C_GA0114222_100957 [Candidatus Kentron sp. FM]VFK08871.1 MAG: hypothetical protein BECKFM1743B_GA0114221_100846 [Candidatus Kentron sp. FM]
MVEGLDAAACYLRPQLVVETLRELRWGVDDGISLRKNQSEISALYSTVIPTGISLWFSRP